MTDKGIARALQSGDQKQIRRAFASIYERYSRLVLFIISKYVRASHDAEDLTEDVFVSCFEAILGGRMVDNIKYYLTSSARNTAINYLARERYVARENERHEHLKDVHYDPEESVISNCAYDDLLRELRSCLSENELAIIIARSINGESFSEIAKARGISQNAAAIRYHRAIKKIRKRGGRDI